MIPTAFLQAWSTKAPWPDLRQVEQDLIICRALCDLFNAPALAGKLAFRGGTARSLPSTRSTSEPEAPLLRGIRAHTKWLVCSKAGLLAKCAHEDDT
mgnify:FL=1